MESRGTQGKGLVTGTRIAMQAEEGVKEAIAKLAEGGENLVQLVSCNISLKPSPGY